MRLLPFLTAPIMLFLAASGANGAEDRYVLEKSGDGFVRMDRLTGEMSVCAFNGATLVCKLATDERTAYQDEIDRLQKSIDGLEGRVAKLENSLSAKLESKLPTEEDFDKTLNYMERFMRKFMGIAKELQDEEQQSQPDSYSRQKT